MKSINPKLIPILFAFAGLVAAGSQSVHAMTKNMNRPSVRRRRRRSGDFHKALRVACEANRGMKSVPGKLSREEIKEAKRRQKATRAFFNQAMKSQGKAA